MLFQQIQRECACVKGVQKRTDSRIQQIEGARVKKMEIFSTMEMSLVSGFQPLFAFSTGYTTTTLVIL